MAESRLSFSSQKVTKHSASTSPWLLSCWLCYWNEFIFNNSVPDTWFGTFLLWRYEWHFSDLWNGVIIIVQDCAAQGEINNESMEDKYVH